MSRRASPRTPSVHPESQGLEVCPTHSIQGEKINAVRAAEMATENTVWTAEWDGCIRIRKLPLGQDVAVLERKDKATFVTALLLVERRMWAALSDGTIRIFDPQSGALLYEFKQHDGAVNCLAQVAGRVYSAGNDWKVFQWRISSNRVPEYERLFYGHTNAVRALCGYTDASGDNTLIFSGGDDALIKAWDPHSPKQNERDVACAHTFQGHTKSVLSLERVPGRQQLWSGGEDSAIRVWDIKSFRPIATLEYHRAPVTSLQFVDTRMWSGGKDGLVFVWDVTQLAPITQVGSEGMRVADSYVLNVKRLFRTYMWKVWTFAANGTIQCWNADVPADDFEVEYDEHEKTNKALIDGLREALMEQTATSNAHIDKVRELQQRIIEIQGEGYEDKLIAMQEQLELMAQERDELKKQRELHLWQSSTAEELMVKTRNLYKDLQHEHALVVEERAVLRKQLADANSDLATANDRYKHATQLLATRDAEAAAAQRAKESVEAVVRDLTRLNEELQERLKTEAAAAQRLIDEERAAHAAEKVAFEECIESLRADAKVIDARVAELTASLEAERNQRLVAEERATTAAAQIAEVERERSRAIEQTAVLLEKKAPVATAPPPDSSPERERELQLQQRDRTIDFLKTEQQALQEELAQHKEKAAQRTAEAVALQSAVSELEAEIKKLRSEAATRAAETRKLNSNLSDAADELKLAQNELAATKEELGRARAKGIESRDQAARLRMQLDELRAQHEHAVAQSESEVSDLRRSLADARRERDVARRAGSAPKQQQQQQPAEAESPRAEEERRRVAEVEALLQRERERSVNLQRELDFMVDENKRLEKSIAEKPAPIPVSTSSASSDRAIDSPVAIKEKTLKPALNPQQQQQMDEARHARDEAIAKVAELNGTIENLYIEIASVRSELEAARARVIQAESTAAQEQAELRRTITALKAEAEEVAAATEQAPRASARVASPRSGVESASSPAPPQPPPQLQVATEAEGFVTPRQSPREPTADPSAVITELEARANEAQRLQRVAEERETQHEVEKVTLVAQLRQVEEDAKHLASEVERLEKLAAEAAVALSHERDLRHKDTELKGAVEARLVSVEADKQRLERELAAARADAARANGELDELRQRISVDRESQSRALLERTSEVTEAAVSKTLLSSENERLQRDVDNLRSRLDAAEQARAEGERESNRKLGEAHASRELLVAQVESLHEQVTKLRSQNVTAVENLGQKTAECEAMRAQLDSANATIARLTPECAEAKQQLSVLAVEKAALKEQLSREVAALQEQIGLLQQNTDAARGDAFKLVSDAHKRNEEQAARIIELELRRAELERAVSSRDAEIESKVVEARQAADRARQLDADVASLRETVARGEERVQQLQVAAERAALVPLLEQSQQTLSAEISKLVLRNDALEADLKHAHDELATVEELRQVVAHRDGTVADLQRLVDERHQSIALLNDKLQQQGAEAGEFRRKLQLQMEATAEQTARLGRIQTQYDELVAKHEALQTSFNAVSSKEDALTRTLQLLDEAREESAAFQRVIARHEADKADLERELVRLAGVQAQLSDAEKKIESLQAELDRKEVAIVELTKQADDGRDFASVCSRLREELGAAETRFADTSRAHAAEIAALRDQLADTQESNRQLHADNERLAIEQVELHDKLATFDSTEQLLLDARHRIDGLSVELQRAVRELQLAQEESAALKLQLKSSGPLAQAEFEATIRELEQQVDRRCQEVESAQQLVAKLERELREEHEAVVALTSNGAPATSTSALSAKVAVLESMLKLADDKVASAQRENSALSSRLRFLEGRAPGAEVVGPGALTVDAGVSSIGARTYALHLSSIVDKLLAELRDQSQHRVVTERLLATATSKGATWRKHALSGAANVTELLDEWDTPRVTELKLTVAAQRLALRRAAADQLEVHLDPHQQVAADCTDRTDGLVNSAVPSQRPSGVLNAASAAGSAAPSRSASVSPSVGRMLALATSGDPSSQVRVLLHAKSQKLSQLQRDVDKLQAELDHKNRLIAMLVRDRLVASGGSGATAIAIDGKLRQVQHECGELAARNAHLEATLAATQENLTAAQTALSSADPHVEQEVLRQQIADLRADTKVAQARADAALAAADAAADDVIALRVAVERAQENESAAKRQLDELHLKQLHMDGMLSEALASIDRQSVVVQNLEEDKRRLEAQLEAHDTRDALLKRWLAGEGYPDEEGASTLEQLREVHTRWQECKSRLEDDEKKVNELQRAAEIATTESRGLGARVADLSANVDRLTAANAEALEMTAARDATIRDLETAKRELSASLDDARSQLERLQHEYDSCLRETATAQERIQGLEAVLGAKDDELSAHAAKVVSLETRVDLMTKDATNREVLIDELRRNSAAMKENYAKREEALGAIEAEITALVAAAARHDQEKRDLDDALRAATSARNSAVAELSDSKVAHAAARAELEDALAEAKRDLHRARDECAATERDAARLRDELSSAKATVTSLTGRLAVSEETIEQVRRNMSLLEQQFSTHRVEAFEEDQETVRVLRTACAAFGVELSGAETKPIEFATAVVDYAGATVQISQALEDAIAVLRDAQADIATASKSVDDDDDDDDDESDDTAKSNAVPTHQQQLPQSKLQALAAQLTDAARVLRARSRRATDARRELESDLRAKEKKYVEMLARNKELHELANAAMSSSSNTSEAKARAAVEVQAWLSKIDAVVRELRPLFQTLQDTIRALKSDRESEPYHSLVLATNPVVMRYKVLVELTGQWRTQVQSAKVFGESA